MKKRRQKHLGGNRRSKHRLRATAKSGDKKEEKRQKQQRAVSDAKGLINDSIVTRANDLLKVVFVSAGDVDIGYKIHYGEMYSIAAIKYVCDIREHRDIGKT